MMSEKEYRADPRPSYSSIKAALKSARAYRHACDHPQEQTAAMLMGTLLHKWILEGVHPTEMCAIKPTTYPAPAKHAKVKKGLIKEGDPLPWNGNAAYCKEWDEAQGGQVISEKDLSNLAGMRAAILADKEAAGYLRQFKGRERKVFGDPPGPDGKPLGLEMRGMLDISGQDETGAWFILDLKKTVDASPAAFQKEIENRHYDLQAEVYTSLLALEEKLETRPQYGWFVTEEEAPHDVAIYWADPEVFETGALKLELAVRRIKAAQKSGKWPGCAPQSQWIRPPGWAAERYRAALTEMINEDNQITIS